MIFLLLFSLCIFNFYTFLNISNNKKGFILFLNKYLAYLIALKLLALLSITKYVCFLFTSLCLQYIKPTVVHYAMCLGRTLQPLKRAVVLRVDSTLQYYLTVYHPMYFSNFGEQATIFTTCQKGENSIPDKELKMYLRKVKRITVMT